MTEIETKNFTGKFQNPEFKPMIKNLQEKLHQGYLNNQRVQKCEKCSKTFYKIFETQNMQNQTNLKYSSNPKDIFKSAKKKKLEKLNSKKDSLKIP